MTSTTALGLPLVQPSQAQKHVTVNEALVRLDALTQLTLASRTNGTPPVGAGDGVCYAVPAAATGVWSGSDGQIAVFANGGWAFVTPKPGWRGWVADEGMPVVFDGAGWIAGAGSFSANGAGLTFRVVEIDHAIAAGPSSDTPDVIPGNAFVFGVTGIVLADITGAAATWSLGIGGISDSRYGSGLGLSAGSFVRGLTSEPLAYFADTPLTLTGEGGDLSSGTVRLAVHIAELGMPRP